MAAGHHRLKALTALVVDDSEQMRSLVHSILQPLGIGTIRHAENAEAAYAELQRTKVDLIVTDWNMAPINGIELTRWVRTNENSRDPFIPIIMLTGHGEVERVCEARDAGVNEFLVKPISPKTLFSRVLSVITQPRPFIKTATFFGPDRRRRNLGPPKGQPERRKADCRAFHVPVPGRGNA